MRSRVELLVVAAKKPVRALHRVISTLQKAKKLAVLYARSNKCVLTPRNTHGESPGSPHDRQTVCLVFVPPSPGHAAFAYLLRG
jgi:hypothetical protein